LFRRAAWGVDLTGGAVQAVHVERHGDDYRILDVVEQPYSPPGNASETLHAHLPDGCDRALHELLNGRRASLSDPIFVALPTFGARHGRIELPVADPQKAATLLDFELHQVLGGDLAPWAVRVGRLEPTQNGLAAAYFAQRRELVASFLEDVRRVGLPVDGLVPGALALTRYARHEWPEPGCQLILQVHRTRTDYVYVTPERTRFRSSPLGCGGLKEPEFLPRDPQKEFDLLASRLVREHHAARKALFGASDGTEITKVHLVGDGARHAALRTALAELFHVEVVVPHASRRITAPRARTPDQTARALQLGTALGLALGALQSEGDEHSLLRPPKERIVARRLPAFTAALLVVAVGLLALRMLVTLDVRREEQLLKQLQARVPWGAADDWEEARRSAQADAARVAELTGKASRLRREVTFPARLLQALMLEQVGARLVSLTLTPEETGDDAELRFEIPDAKPGAAEQLEAHLTAHAGVTVVATESATGKDGALTVALRVTVNPQGEAP
jgi:Tfp pilus assembly protein PilV